MWFTAQSHVTYFYRINIYLAVKIHRQGQCAMDFIKLRLFSLETLQEVQMETVILLSLVRPEEIWDILNVTKQNIRDSG